MLFKRRDKERFIERMKIWFWPRRSWKRSVSYVMNRVSRLTGSPHFITLGFVTGVFVSFTPYLGLHFLIAGFIAWMIGGSILASALGTFFGNPLTFPFIWGSTYKLGNWVLGGQQSGASVDLTQGVTPSYEGVWAYMGSLFSSFDKLWMLIKPMTIGAMPMGLVAAVLLYYPVRKLIEAYQNGRRNRIDQRRKKLADERRGATAHLRTSTMSA